MVKIKHKTAFKRSLRDAKGPDSKNPYVSPALPEEALLRRAEDACKELAAHDVANRDVAVSAINTLLRKLESGESDVDVSLEFAKLWHGLFYCMWHSDKPLVQLDCAERIANLVMTLKSWELRAEWLRHGWETLQKMWGNIDKWRVNKYYSLMRLLFRKHLICIAEAAEKLGDSEEDEDIMFAAFCGSLLETYNTGLSGVASHITDILIEECVEVQFSADNFTMIFMHLVFPVLTSGDSYQCEHLYDFVWTKLLGGYKENDATIGWLADVQFDILQPTMEAATVDESTKDANRDLLVKMQDELDNFLGQADEFQDGEEELVEVDSDEELAEVRAATREEIALKQRQEADTVGNKRQQVKARRAVERRLKKAEAKGDEKSAKDLLKAAKQSGIVIPQAKKRKKGQAKLKKLVGKDGQELAKGAKKHKRKRRI
eukprot:TRINITY_DN23210_c0_g1_i1.p1 TRINITY_DN23210_c0_g1~~TRINITY_DN23210_c0_g1_i1.p1  ORF type:complete len:431 (+),score=202.73 TRINITY_DN23210_c0_g1_i1:121-1413(+)